MMYIILITTLVCASIIVLYLLSIRKSKETYTDDDRFNYIEARQIELLRDLDHYKQVAYINPQFKGTTLTDNLNVNYDLGVTGDITGGNNLSIGKTFTVDPAGNIAGNSLKLGKNIGIDSKGNVTGENLFVTGLTIGDHTSINSNIQTNNTLTVGEYFTVSNNGNIYSTDIYSFGDIETSGDIYTTDLHTTNLNAVNGLNINNGAYTIDQHGNSKGNIFTLNEIDFNQNVRLNTTDGHSLNILGNGITMSNNGQTAVSWRSSSIYDNNSNLNLVSPYITAKTGQETLNFTGNYMNKANRNTSEIANDTGTYQGLILAGNTSSNGHTRRVGVLDELDVYGNLYASNNIFAFQEIGAPLIIATEGIYTPGINIGNSAISATANSVNINAPLNISNTNQHTNSNWLTITGYGPPGSTDQNYINIGDDNINRGISVFGTRPFEIYNQHNTGLSIDTKGNTTIPNLISPNATISSLNASGNTHFNILIASNITASNIATSNIQLLNNGAGLQWTNNSSHIYDNGDLHINTDDNMWMSAPTNLNISTNNTDITNPKTNQNLRFSSVWTGSTDNVTGNSEISNDITGYKQLMIVGNRSGGGPRKVGIWDELDVNGQLNVNGNQNITGNLCLGSTCINQSTLNTLTNDGQNMTTQNLVLGNKWHLAGGIDGAGSNDSWLRLLGTSTPGQYYGGLAVGGLSNTGPVYLNGGGTGTTTIGGQTTIANSANITGTTTIGGATTINNSLTANSANITGTTTIGGSTTINNSLTANSANINGNLGVTGTLSVGKMNYTGSPSFGDMTSTGTATMNNINVNGPTNINNKLKVSHGDGNWNWIEVDGNYGDQLFFGSDSGNRGIWASGNRNFSIYNQQNTGLTVDTGGNTIINNLNTSRITSPNLDLYSPNNGYNLRFSSGWTATPDGSYGNSEISNDTQNFKTLMIVGNKSRGNGNGPRNVSVWDTLTVNGTFYNQSDRDSKSDIEYLNSDDFDNISKLRPATFKYKLHDNDKINHGFIAQDVEEIYPNLINDTENGKGLDYIGLSSLTLGKLNKHIPQSDTLCLDDVCINKSQLQKLKSLINTNV